MMKKISRRVFSVLMALALVLTTVAIAAPTALLPKADAAVSKASGAATPNVMFTVPEAIYLAPTWDCYSTVQEMPFQWYVNNTMSTGGAVTPKNTVEEKTGAMYFYYANATSVNISFDFVNANGTVLNGGTITYGDNISRTAGLNYTTKPSTTSIINITAGKSPSMEPTTTGVWIRWKATYRDTSDNRDKTCVAYTYVYKPYVQPVGVTIKTENDRGTNHFGSDISWISGVHDTKDGTGGSDYPRTALAPIHISSGSGSLMVFSNSNSSKGVKLGNLYGQFASATDNQGRWTYDSNNVGPGGWVTTSATGVPDKSFRSVASSTGSSRGDSTCFTLGYAPTAVLTVDTSRYTNFNQIPNLSVGIQVTDDEASSKGGAWFVSNYSGSPLASDIKDYNTNNTANATAHWDSYSKEKFASEGNYDNYSASEVEGVKYNGRWTKTISSTMASGMHYLGTGYFNHDGSGSHYGGDTIFNIAELRVQVNTYNKSNLRAQVVKIINNSAKFDEAFFDTNSAAWINYQNLYRAAYMGLTKLDGTFSVSAVVNGSTKTYTNPNDIATALNDALVVLNNGTGRVSAKAVQTNIALIQQDNGTYRCVQMKGVDTTKQTNFTTFEKVTFTAESATGYSFVGLVKTASAPNVVFNSIVSYPSAFTTSALGANISGSTVIIPHADAEGTDGNGNIYYTYYYLVNKYYVKFDGNGSDAGTMDNQKFFYNVEQSLNTNIYTKRGHTFQGWSTTKGGAVAYADGASLSTLTGVNEQTVTLYAVWSADSYSISYNAAGGTLPASGYTTSYTITDTVTLPVPTRPGYTFEKWRADGSGNWGPIEYKTDSAVPAGKYGNVSFTAIWTANKYKVVFNGNGGAGSTDQQDFTFDVDQALRANGFTKTGCTFLGWATTPGATSYTYQNVETVRNLTTQANGVVTLYAVWQTETYTIVYSADNGQIKDSTTNYTKNYTVDSVINLPVNVVKTGYTFEGWAPTKAVGNWNTATIYKGTINAGMNGTVTLRAQWTATGYTIVYNADGGTITGRDYTTAYTIEDAIKIPTVTKAGYAFAGWTSDDAGNWGVTTYTAGTISSGKYGDVTLTATWSGVTYYVAFNGNNSTSGMMVNQAMTYGKSATLNPNAYVRNGYKFLGWATSLSATSAQYADMDNVTNLATQQGVTVTLYAVWQKQAYTVTYNGNGGTVTGSYTTDYTVTDRITLPTATKHGYTFAGWKPTSNEGNWKTDESFTTSINAGKYGSVTLAADWNPIKYTITYVANNGTLSGTYTTEYDISTTIVLATVTRPGFTFGGWQASGGWENKLYKTAPKGVTGNVTLTATWSKDTYVVHFNGNGATGSMSDVTFSCEVEEALPLNTFTRSGYDFLGWALTETGSVVYSNGTTVFNLASKDGEVTLYAVWNIKNFSLQYNLNGNTGSLLSHTVTLNGASITLRAYAKTDVVMNGMVYDFAGWSFTKADADAGIIAYANNASFTLTDAVLEKMAVDWSGSKPTVTLYASWTLRSVDIAYNMNGASATLANTAAVLNGAAVTLASYAEDVTIDGVPYVFGGWAVSKQAADAGTVAYESGASLALTDAVLAQLEVDRTGAKPVATLYAVWNNVKITFEPKDDSTAIVDTETNTIYGLKIGVTEQELKDQFLSVTGNGHIEVVYTDFVGTGTVVNVVSDATGEVVESYTIVIFGDVNGDGAVNAVDISMLKAVNSGAIELADGSAKGLAADINGDGVVNGTDIVTIKAMFSGSASLNQADRTLS